MPVGDMHCRLLEMPGVGSRFPTSGRIDLRVIGVGSVLHTLDWIGRRVAWVGSGFPTLGSFPLGEGWKWASYPRRQRLAGTRVGSVLPTLAQVRCVNYAMSPRLPHGQSNQWNRVCKLRYPRGSGWGLA